MDNVTLHNLRKNILRMTQADFGKALGVTRFTVMHWEAGRFAIPADINERMAVAGLSKPTEPERPDPQDVLAEYAKQRGWGATHTQVLELWTKSGFNPSPAAQQLILEAFPDILDPPVAIGETSPLDAD